ncbi:MAG: hypothetical protein ACRECH_04615 [Nitrososphaerales archaeon]
MPSFTTAKLPIPKSWDEFEDITADAIRVLWDDNFITRNARTGQRQNGVDIFGKPSNLDGEYGGVQCKNLTMTFEEITIAISEAESFKPQLKQFIVAIGAPRDSKIQEAVRLIDLERVTDGKFSVRLLFWDDLTLTLAGHRELYEKHFPQFIEEKSLLKHTIESRLEHSLFLMGQPLEDIRQSLDYPDGFLMVWANGATNEIIRRRIDVMRDRSPNSLFLLSHFESGYGELYESIFNYEQAFNKLVDRELAVYHKAESILSDFASSAPVHWEVSVARAIEAFSGQAEVELGRGGKSEKARNDGVNGVRLGSYILGHTDSEETADEMVACINSLFDNQDVYGQLREIYKIVRTLLEDRKKIDRDFEQIKALVQSKVPLDGWCAGGRTGDYE